MEVGKPEQFCTPVQGLKEGTPLYVAAYPAAWKIEVVDDEIHRGFEYVRSEPDVTLYPGLPY